METKTKAIIGAAIIILILFIIILNTLASVPTGHAGIKTRFGAVQNDIISEGLNFKVPFIEDIKIMDCRTQKTDVNGESASNIYGINN